MAARGGLRLGVDFTGGTQVEVQVLPNSGTSDVPIRDVRDAVAAAGFDNRAIQKAGGGEINDFLIHVQTGAGAQADTTGEGRHVSERIKGELQKRFPDQRVVLRGVESVGPKVGSELKSAAVQAVLASILLILVYVAFRFEFRFGVATIVAAAHDVLFVLGLFSLSNKEMDLTVIAAFLTLVGYSVNDTIVVFDRIREELKLRQKREAYEVIFNSAINKTLSRTLLTGVTTLIVLASLYFAGGEVIHDFSWVLLTGILVGTYSSIFVAAPMLVEWQKRADMREAAKANRAA
jgi:preprotein translocase subunit SecF